MSGARRSVAPLLLMSGSVLGLLGCKDLAGTQPLPSGTENPSFYNTPSGALGMRTAVLYTVEQELPAYITDTGLLTDELESNQDGASPGIRSGASLPIGGSLDARILPEQSYGGTGTAADGDYTQLQLVRGQINQAIGALATYDTVAADTAIAKEYRGELYALQGYAEILLADFFCSGVPLSTLDFQKDYTYHAGGSTAQVYRDAIGKLDTALILARDSARIVNLALVLKGRAWLDLGQYDSAAVAVAAVPDGFGYQLAIVWDPNQANFGNNADVLSASGTVADREGRNGLPYLSSGDPRSAIINDTSNIRNSGFYATYAPLYFPAKYSETGFSAFTVADWVEARLIQAEVALQANPNDPQWLTILNSLRATAPVPGTMQPATAQQLPQLSDPGDSPNDSARVSLLFQERAYWLFLTGHRQGDLRRLVRQYGRRQDQVYPSGPYTAPGTFQYGGAVVAPIPGTEYVNPLFHGCLNTDA